MKTLKLNQIEKNILSKNEMNEVKGGGCGCACSNNNMIDNGGANADGGLHSPGGNNHVFCDTVFVH